MSAVVVWTCDVCHITTQKDITGDAAAGMRVYVGYPEAQGWRAGQDCDTDVCGRVECHDVQRQREGWVPEEDGDTYDTVETINPISGEVA